MSMPSRIPASEAKDQQRLASSSRTNPFHVRHLRHRIHLAWCLLSTAIMRTVDWMLMTRRGRVAAGMLVVLGTYLFAAFLNAAPTLQPGLRSHSGRGRTVMMMQSASPSVPASTKPSVIIDVTPVERPSARSFSQAI